MRSTSPPAAGLRRPAGMVEVPHLAEVIQLHTPTVADPTDALPDAGGQLALPLFLLLPGGAE